VETNIKVSLPRGCYGRIAPRSGLALHHGIDVGGGVIDPDYEGTIGVILFNHSDRDFVVNKGDRIAQLIPEKIFNYDSDSTEESIGSFDSVRKEVREMKRAKKGFGSSGITSKENEN